MDRIKTERSLKLEKVNQNINIMDFVSIEVLTRTFRPDRCNCGGRMAYNGSVIACVNCGNYRLIGQE